MDRLDSFYSRKSGEIHNSTERRFYEIEVYRFIVKTNIIIIT